MFCGLKREAGKVRQRKRLELAMEYQNVYTARFVERPNRFIALVEMDGSIETCHVKNTGRCRELLIPGARVYLEKSGNLKRKTAYDLVGVDKNGVYVNMDSQAPNKVAHEWLLQQGWDLVKPEYKYGNSRLDFYMEKAAVGTAQTGEPLAIRRAFMEVKGVTLEENGIARFPDAPTQRGIKHIEELVKAYSQGYEAYILFVIQMKGIRWFEPNDATHPAFGEALRRAHRAGVQVLAYDCLARPGSIELDREVPVRL